MSEKKITREESERRLVELFSTGRLSRYPSNRRDKHIILKSIIMTLDISKTYSKRGITRKLNDWLKAMHQPEGLDKDILLERLLEEGYLRRNRDSSQYWIPETRPDRTLFDPDVDEMDVLGIIDRSRNQSTNIEEDDEIIKRILTHAAKLFWVKGLAFTTFRDIALASGLSVTAIRSIFPDEETLYKKLLEISALDWQHTIMKSDNPDDSFRNRLASLIKAKMELARSGNPAYRLLTREWLEHAETGANPRLDLGIGKPLTYMERMIAQAVERGEIREVNPNTAVWFIVGLGFLYGSRQVEKFLDTRKPLTNQDVCEYVELIMKGLSK